MAGLTAADLDADWKWFDNLTTVTVALWRPATQDYGSDQRVEALTTGEDIGMEPAGDGGEVHSETKTIPLRASMVTGKVIRGTKITDADGRVWVVERAAYRSWRTRIVCQCRSAGG